MILPLLVPLVLAHGGEQHAEEAPAAPVTASASRAAAEGARYDAVVLAGEGGHNVTVLLADQQTSAPVSTGALTLSLTGPEALTLSPASAPAPGFWLADAELHPGTWAGALVVSGEAGGDLLAVEGLVVGAPAAESEPGHPEGLGLWAAVLAAAAGLGVGLGGGWGVGWAAGRRRGAVLALVGLAWAASSPGALAHGDAVKATFTTLAQVHLALESQFLLGLRTEPLRTGPFQPRAQAFGTLHGAPSTHAALRAPLDGTLRPPEGGWPHPGAEVKAGEVLAWVEERPAAAERADLAAARAEAAVRVAQAQEALALAQRDAAQVAGLGEALPARERLAREQALTRAEAEHTQAQAALEALRGGLRTAITAPFTGRLVRVDAHPADWVLSGDPVFEIQGPGGLQAELAVPPAARGSHGQDVVVAWRGQQAHAVLMDPGLSADPRTGLVRATARIPNVPEGWLPGVGVVGWLPAGEAGEALTVPDAAVLESGGIRLVFVKTGPEDFVLRQLRLGARDGAAWAVDQGLSPGDRVVTSGVESLRAVVGR